MTHTFVIGAGPALPDDAELDAFWAEAKAAVPELSDDH
jgi:hypothetical protein